MNNKYNNLKRDLKSRHLIMMALGGTIGTGLLLASGKSVMIGGPGGAILGYGLVSILVFFLMTSLGEMSAQSPTTGSFCDYSARYVDKSFGFAMSWNYWLNWVLVIASEVLATALVMQFWFPDTPVWIWTISFFALIIIINLFAVKIYGEVEYALAFIKVATVVIFIIVGCLMIFGIVGNQGSIGFQNITLGDAPFHNGWVGFLGVFLVAGYSFQGVELLGVASGESKTPKKSIPIAVKTVFWRIILFYILAIVVISFLIPYTDPALTEGSVTSSPFTLVFERLNIPYVASIMNFVVISAILSAANASLFTASRIIWHMGKSKEAPRFFAKTNTSGVPVAGLVVSVIGCAFFVLLSVVDSGLIFGWLINIISIAGFIAWFGISLSHYRYRRAYLKQGYKIDKLTYRSPFFPLGPLCSMVFIVAITIGGQAVAIFQGGVSWAEISATYAGLAFFIVLLVVYKIVKKTRYIKLEEIDI